MPRRGFLDKPLLQSDKFGRGFDLVGSRVREVDRDLCPDAAGTGAHDDDAAAEEDGFLDIVGNEQHDLLVALPDAEQHFLHQHARLIVERTEGLIEQEDLWVIGKRTRDRGTLLHAAGELLRPMPLEARQADALDEPSAILPRSDLERPRSRRPNAIFSRTVNQGNSV